MDSKSLMIGDLVYNTHNKKYIKITAYDFFTHHHNNDGTQSFKGIIEPMLTRGFDLEPIPLTAEILEKNGFEEYITIGGYHYHHDIEITEDNDNELSIDVCGNLVMIEYVHELQHALRLCGLNELADNFIV